MKIHVFALSAALLLPAAATLAASKDSDVLVTINGTKIKKAEALDRTWKKYGVATLNEMVDDIIIRQEADKLKIKADKKAIKTRLKRIKDQFKDEDTMQGLLNKQGSSIDKVRAGIEEQVLREAMVVKARKLTASKREVRAFFKENKARLGVQDSVHLRHILVATEKEANDFMLALNAGADFAQLARQASLDQPTRDKGGDLGFVSKGFMAPEIEKMAFSKKVGEPFGPVKTRAGFHLLRVEEFRSPKPAVFKEIKGDIERMILGEKIKRAWPGYLAELRAKAKIVLPKAK